MFEDQSISLLNFVLLFGTALLILFAIVLCRDNRRLREENQKRRRRLNL